MYSFTAHSEDIACSLTDGLIPSANGSYHILTTLSSYYDRNTTSIDERVGFIQASLFRESTNRSSNRGPSTVVHDNLTTEFVPHTALTHTYNQVSKSPARTAEA
jgi:hypothetical protein